MNQSRQGIACLVRSFFVALWNQQRVLKELTLSKSALQKQVKALQKRASEAEARGGMSQEVVDALLAGGSSAVSTQYERSGCLHIVLEHSDSGCDLKFKATETIVSVESDWNVEPVL
eukprot:INCI13430.17.p2 GENE.INCI13430.17~~INCI13430.17.p2  ORF type:complete len:117 (-),score=29.48 INCI13430.17:423-773(-)